MSMIFFIKKFARGAQIFNSKNGNFVPSTIVNHHFMIFMEFRLTSKAIKPIFAFEVSKTVESSESCRILQLELSL